MQTGCIGLSDKLQETDSSNHIALHFSPIFYCCICRVVTVGHVVEMIISVEVSVEV